MAEPRIVEDALAEEAPIRAAMETHFTSGLPFDYERWATQQNADPNTIIVLHEPYFAQLELLGPTIGVQVVWWVPNSASDPNIVIAALPVLRRGLVRVTQMRPAMASWLVWGQTPDEALVNNWVATLSPVITKHTGNSHPSLPAVRQVWRGVGVVQELVDKAGELILGV